MTNVLEHPVAQYVILVLAVVGGILAIKVLGSRLPDGGIPGAAKSVIASI